jgi:hypothetical protein
MPDWFSSLAPDLFESKSYFILPDKRREECHAPGGLDSAMASPET